MMRLTFKEKEGDESAYFVAVTPFGQYEYYVDHAGKISEVVVLHSFYGESKPFARCGNYITAQQLCEADFNDRLRRSLGL